MGNIVFAEDLVGFLIIIRVCSMVTTFDRTILDSKIADLDKWIEKIASDDKLLMPILKLLETHFTMFMSSGRTDTNSLFASLSEHIGPAGVMKLRERYKLVRK